MDVVKDYKSEFDEVINAIRIDLNKLVFDITNFKKLLDSFYPQIKK